MPSIRAASSARNFAYSSPVRRIGVQLRFFTSSAQAALPAMVSTSFTIAALSSSETSGGANTPRQLKSSISTPCSFSVGASIAFLTLVGGYGEQTQRAGLHLLGEFAITGNAGRDLIAQQRCKRLATAGKRHVGDRRRINARRFCNEAKEDVIGAAG